MHRAPHLLHRRMASTAAASLSRASVGSGRAMAAAAAASAGSRLFAPMRISAQAVRFPHSTTNTPLHGTTILAVRKGKDVVVIGDGQVSMGGTVFKPNARKVRIIGGGKVICGFAGSTADCFALLDALEKKLDEYPGQLLRAGVELAKMWRTDKFLRHLEALLIAVDKDISITLSGNGDVISEPLDGVIGIGSGGLYALSAARALVDVPDLTPRQIAVKSMRIAAEICVYTNKNFTIEAFENGELLVGEARLARLRHDSELAEAADKAERRKIELNSLSSITPSTNTTSTDQSTITPPAPQSQTPQ